jgi:hypothetical protein
MGLSTSSTALAAPHVIARLGTAPLVAGISSTTELQRDIALHKRLYSDAAAKIGLSPAEYARFILAVRTRHVTYGTIPRHLDAMTGMSGGTVSVVRDVIVPKDTRGWEVDVVESHHVLAIVVPAACGNISLVRKSLPVLARSKPHVRRHIDAASAIRIAALMPSVVRPSATPVPSPAPSATPAPYEAAAATTGPPHHFGLWPLLVLPIAATFFMHSGHGGAIGVPPLPVAGAPNAIALPRPGPGGIAVPLNGDTPLPPGCPNPTPSPH